MSSPSTTDGSLLGRWLGRAALLLALFASTATIAPPAARATHERASLITWSPAGGNAVEFTITGAWRRSAYSTANGRCRNPNDTVAPVLESIACSGLDGFANPGDVIVESQGGTQFNPGSGSLISSPLGSLLYLVTSVDPVNDWLFATAIDSTSLPAIDTTIFKNYPSPGTRTAFIQDCCRVSNTVGGNQHINNPDGDYRIETRVTAGGTNRPPVSTMPPIVLCPKDGICAFTVPAADPDNDPVTFRLSTSTEASGSSGGFTQPGPTDAPNAASIDINTGIYTWNTTGATIGSPSSNTYYSTQVTIEDRDGMNNVKSRIAVDFLIQIVDQNAGVPPVFDHPPTPACGSTININAGGTANFTVQASDSDFGQTVTLNVVGLPAGATLTPPLPTTTNPVSTTFNWVSSLADAGMAHVVTFTANDTANQQAQCSITIQVAQCQSNAECDDGNACTTDTCDPMSIDANTAGCVNETVVCDACQVCDENLGCTGSICTSTPTVTLTPTPTVTETGTPQPTSTPTETPTPYCGDGHLGAGESCDDGNAFPNDGCEPVVCTVSTTCVLDHPGTERFVGGCGAPTYGTIQAAIDAASDGDVITICSGTYTQPIVVTKQVLIHPEDGGSVTVHTANNTFDVRRSGVQIDGLTIQSDAGTAISANTICPLGQSSCPMPGSGTNLTITNNTIHDSPVGIAWQRRIDCAHIENNTLAGNGVHVALQQQEGVPAILVVIQANDITSGGDDGAAVTLSGLGANVAANSIDGSVTNGIVLANVPGGGATQVIENAITNSVGDGITVKAGAAGTGIHNNNITHNGVGLGNESSSGTLDATLNWWNSQTGPSGLFTGVGDTIVNRNAGADTTFIEFLCKPFPQGFASTQGVCSVETPELRQLVPGTNPDIDPSGGFIAFESKHHLDVDPGNGDETAINNFDGSQEIFLLNRQRRAQEGGVCIGGAQPCDVSDVDECAACTRSQDCPGNPGSDPIVLEGECVKITQLTNDPNPLATMLLPRVTRVGKYVFFSTDRDLLGSNPDGSSEIYRWVLKTLTTEPVTSGGGAQSSQAAAPSRASGRYIAVESASDPAGGNADGNTEIMLLHTASNTWTQVTSTLAPVENRHPATFSGRRILFDSNGDLDNDPKTSQNNTDGNREVFLARMHGDGSAIITQLTDTVAPVVNLAGGTDISGKRVVFSSNGNLGGENADGNREVFAIIKGALSQVTHTLAGPCDELVTPPCGNVNPRISSNGRWTVFESTEDIENDGATNRRVFQYNLENGKLLRLSRSRFGDNRAPQLRKKRFVVWESTSNLTGGNPNNESVIYLFDRKKD